MSYGDANNKFQRRVSITGANGDEWGFFRLDVANPNGTVMGTDGDIGRAVDGTLYQCHGGSVWTALVSGVFTGLAVVAPLDPGSEDDGDTSTPFVTIQGALNAIGVPVDVADQKTRWSILVVSGQYDEDLTIPQGRRITFVPMGPLTLGDGAGADYQSTVPRSITMPVDPLFGERATLTIGTLIPGCIYGDRCTQSTAFDVSGDLLLTGTPTVPEAATVRLMMTRIRGNLDASGVTALAVDLHCTGVRVDGDVVGTPNMLLIHATRSYFRGEVNVRVIGHANACTFGGDLTVTAPPTAAGTAALPPGFYACDFRNGATYTGPANSLLLDASSNYWFKDDGWALGGAASKVILGDLTP